MDLMEKEKLEQKVEEYRKSYAQNGHLKDFDEDFGNYEKVYGGNVKERK